MSQSGQDGAASDAGLRALERAWPRATHLTFGPYRLGRELGAGGFGMVCLAEDLERTGLVALKLARPEVAFTPALRGWLRREARAVRRLEHPAIPALMGAGSIGPIDYLATAYFPAPTLAEWLSRRGGTVPARTAAKIARLLAAAVAHAHDRGVVHCDLTPTNVLVADGGRVVRLIDFGMARFVDRPGDAPRDLRGGTRGFAAPEQLRGDDAGPAADVYGVGAVLYTMVSGRPPGPHRRLPAHLPAALAEICRRCLARSPDRRYEATALAAALDDFLADQSRRRRP